MANFRASRQQSRVMRRRGGRGGGGAVWGSRFERGVWYSDRCGGDRVEGAAFRDEFPSVWQNFKWDEGSRLGSLEWDNLWCCIVA